MPKKYTRNAYYFFVQDFKEQKRKEGIIYQNMAEAFEHANSEWQKTPPSIKQKYKEKEKEHKNKVKVPEQKFTSHGVSIAELEREEREKREAEELERMEINNMIRVNMVHNQILDNVFYVIDVNPYCQAKTDFIIGEFTILKFNLKEGIIDNYHELINPEYIPPGYGSDVKHYCIEFDLDFPDEDLPKSDSIQILANIIDYLNNHSNKQGNRTVLPPLFTLCSKLREVQSFIMQLCNKATEDPNLFRIYKLDYLFYSLVQALHTHSRDEFPKESLASSQLQKDVFMFNPGLECQHHEHKDRKCMCTMSRVKRWAFTIFDKCCPLVGITVIPGSHLPHEFDVDLIVEYKQEKKVQRAIQATTAPSSSNTSMIGEDLNNSTASNTSVASNAWITPGRVARRSVEPRPLRSNMNKRDMNANDSPRRKRSIISIFKKKAKITRKLGIHWMNPKRDTLKRVTMLDILPCVWWSRLSRTLSVSDVFRLPPPELTETDFPNLSASCKKGGKGRGTTSSLSKSKIDK